MPEQLLIILGSELEIMTNAVQFTLFIPIPIISFTPVQVQATSCVRGSIRGRGKFIPYFNFKYK